MQRVAVSMLPVTMQNQIRRTLRSNLLEEGIRGEELEDAVERGMDSWLDQLDEHENIPMSYKWSINKCDCGTYEGLDLAASAVEAGRFVCGPSRDCEENRNLRELICQYVYNGEIPMVCEAFGITMIVYDGKDD